ncbi:MAG: cell division protein FtsA [Deltaproteobacteria bacterium]|jgi:cell division protein FtsA|nr:cell division protein FtsA [Deltaproteobacteria bacterium]
MPHSEIITVLDLGTSKTRCVMAEVDGKGKCSVIGFGGAVSQGVSRGKVVDPAKASASFREAVSRAESVSGRRAERFHLGVAGGNVKSHNAVSAAEFMGGDGRVISEADKFEAMHALAERDLPEDRKILHAVARDYFLDGIRVPEPAGRRGKILEIDAHVVTASAEAVSNAMECARLGGARGETVLVNTTLAAAEASLFPEEMESGAALLEMGAGCTGLIVFSGGVPALTGVLTFGGANFTRDLSQRLGLSLAEAEDLKIIEGLTPAPMPSSPEKGAGGAGKAGDSWRRAHALRARATEILSVCRQEMVGNGLLNKVGSIVLTGGCAMFKGLTELAAEIFALPVRVGRPLAGSVPAGMVPSPGFSAAAGLILLAMKWTRPRDGSPGMKFPAGASRGGYHA